MTKDTSATSSLFSALRRLYPLARPLVPMLALGLLSAVLAAAIKLLVPQTLRVVVNDSLTSSAGEMVLWIGVATVAGLGVLEAALVSMRRRFVIRPGTVMESDLRVRLYRHFVEMPASFHDHWTGGQLLSRSVSDVRRIRRWLSFGMIMTCTNFLTIVAGGTLLLLTNWLLGTLYLLVVLPAFAVSLRARREYRALSRRSLDQIGDLGTTIEESVQGIRVLKAYGRELRALEDFSEQAEELRSTELGKARRRAFITLVMSAAPGSALAVILVICIFLVAAGTLTTGALLAFFATAAILAGPLERLSDQFAMSMEAKTAIDRYFDALDVSNDLQDPLVPAPIPVGPGVVTFTGVSFGYRATDGAVRSVLDGLDLTIRAGETLALVGLTGSGKSTLAHLLPRFYDVTAGAVRIDGTDVRDLSRHDVRVLVSIAFDEPVLFSATVRDNVALGRQDATDDEVRAALEVAQASFVDQLEYGLDTRIGEEGVSLSGGQRQRLALARAVLARPRVLVLDDPLSALDVRTEAEVATRLRRHLRGTSTLVVANRPSTAAIADRVAVLHRGSIAAIGTHAELLARSPLYQQILSGLPGTPADQAEAVSA